MENFFQLAVFSSLGLLIALLVYFEKDIKKIFDEFRQKTRVKRKRKSKLLIYIIITCVVGALAGWSSAELIENWRLFTDIYSLAIIIGLTGIAMIVVDNAIKKDKLKDENKMNASHAIIIGSSGIFASLPGVFYPAANIIAGRLIGFNNKTASRYALITFIPFVCSTFIGALFSSDGFSYASDNLTMLLVSNIITFIISFWVITLLMYILKKSKTLQWFGYSRVVISLVITIIALLS